MEEHYYTVVALFIAFGLDLFLGDPRWLPHPIVGFGKAISWLEKLLNKGERRFFKGVFTTLLLVLSVYAIVYFIDRSMAIHPLLGMMFKIVVIFYSISGVTLRREVRNVFVCVNRSLKEGREALSRIVGRDTAQLDEQQIRGAALETLSENLSDGSVAPLFWLAVLGVPGMMAYKMVNTLDSMIGYKNEQFIDFGKFSAYTDDFVNILPSRLTAFLMLLVTGKLGKIAYVFTEGRNHASPNSGYPEAALSAILNCRFGGPNSYFGKTVYKPYIGKKEKRFTTMDMLVATDVNRRVEIIMIILVASLILQ